MFHRVLFAALLGSAAFSGDASAGVDRPGLERVGEVKKEMTADEVAKIVGNPNRIARMILFRRHIEQWIYDDLNKRIEFLCFPGEEPRVLQILDVEPQLRP